MESEEGMEEKIRREERGAKLASELEFGCKIFGGSVSKDGVVTCKLPSDMGEISLYKDEAVVIVEPTDKRWSGATVEEVKEILTSPDGERMYVHFGDKWGMYIAKNGTYVVVNEKLAEKMGAMVKVRGKWVQEVK